MRSRLRLILLYSVLLLVASACGCSRTVLIREADPIRIGPDTRSRVYTMIEGEWRLSPNRVEIPEGWYCVPPSFVDAQP